MRSIPLVLLVVVGAPACLDDESPRLDDVASHLSLPGSTCDEHSDCDSAIGAGDGYCYRGDVGGSLVFPDEGYCTIDDGSGAVCAVDADCPSNSRCADIYGYRLCLPACGEDDACPAGQACMATFGGLPLAAPVCLPGSSTAQDGDACTEFYDCGESSTCWNDIENPGGYCSAYNCTVGTNVGCNGGVCIDFTDGPATGTICVESCTVDADCREAEGYVCHDSYCRRPHVGDPCASSEECGAGWTCNTGAAWSGGYCTLTGCPTPGSTEGCSSGSICAAVGGANMCIDRCATVGAQSTCRSGYACTAVGAQNGGGCLAPQ